MKVHALIGALLVVALLGVAWLTSRDDGAPTTLPPAPPAVAAPIHEPGDPDEPMERETQSAGAAGDPATLFAPRLAATGTREPHRSQRIVIGRVVDTVGRPVPDATVWLTDERDGAVLGEQRPDAPKGRFEARVHGTSVRVQALSSRVGTALWRHHPVVDGRTVLPDLVLEPFDTIGCIARFPDGSPVAHLLVRAERGKVSDAPGRAGFPSESYGLTDRSGRVRLAGLTPDDYAVSFPSLQGHVEEVRVRTNGPPPIVAVDVPLLAIRVDDEHGRPIDQGKFRLLSWSSPLADPLAERYRIDGELPPDPPPSTERVCWNLGHDWAHAAVDPDSFVVVRWTPTGFAPQEHAVRVRPGRWLTEVRFTRRPLPNGARLAIDLRLDGGEPVSRLTATLTPLDGGSARKRLQVTMAGEGVLPAVLPGRYRVRLAPDRRNLRWKDVPTSGPTCFDAVQQDVTLVPGDNALHACTVVRAAVTVYAPWTTEKAVRFELSRGIRRHVITIDSTGVNYSDEPDAWFFVEPGRWTVRATTAGKPAVVETVDAVANRVHRVDL